MEADRGSGGPARVQPTMRPSGPPFLVWEYWRNWVRQRERIWAWKGVFRSESALCGGLGCYRQLSHSGLGHASTLALMGATSE